MRGYYRLFRSGANESSVDKETKSVKLRVEGARRRDGGVRKLTEHGWSVTRSTSVSLTKSRGLRRTELTIGPDKRSAMLPGPCLIDRFGLDGKSGSLKFSYASLELNALRYRLPLRPICMIALARRIEIYCNPDALRRNSARHDITLRMPNAAAKPVGL